MARLGYNQAKGEEVRNSFPSRSTFQLLKQVF